MMSLAASDSTVGAPVLTEAFTAEPELEHHLEHARRDHHHRHWLFASLLAGKVWVIDLEIVLGHDGPYYELQPRADGGTLSLGVYTNFDRMPATAARDEAEHLPFSEVLRLLPAGVDLLLNAEGPHRYRIGADELALLRRVDDAA